MEWAEPTEPSNLTSERCDEIVHIVEDLLEPQIDNTEELFDWIRGTGNYSFEPLDQKLRAILSDLGSYPSDELSMWLRSTYRFRDNLSTWEPLLNATVSQARARNNEQWVKETFIGLLQLAS